MERSTEAHHAEIIRVWDLGFQFQGVFLFHYRSQRSWDKVMFLHVSVILFTGGYPSMHWARPPWQGVPPTGRPPSGRQTPPGKETPPGRQIPPGRQTSHTPGKETPLARRPPSPPALRDTVNERTVCILLESNLVLIYFWISKDTNFTIFTA